MQKNNNNLDELAESADSIHEMVPDPQSSNGNLNAVNNPNTASNSNGNSQTLPDLRTVQEIFGLRKEIAELKALNEVKPKASNDVEALATLMQVMNVMSENMRVMTDEVRNLAIEMKNSNRSNQSHAYDSRSRSPSYPRDPRFNHNQAQPQHMNANASHQPRSYSGDRGYCHFHKKFGLKAFTCEKPCSFPQNYASAGNAADAMPRPPSHQSTRPN